MNRNQLEIFFSLSKTLNFTKTAKEFYTSQPTISRQISLLEEEWGLSLFVRNKREVSLTLSGEIMYEKCMEALKLIDDGIAKSKEAINGTTGEIRIGILETMNSSNIRSGKGVALLDTSIAAVSDESRYKFFPISKDVAPLSLVYAWRIDNVNSALDQFINTLFIKEHIDVFHH